MEDGIEYLSSFIYRIGCARGKALRVMHCTKQERREPSDTTFSQSSRDMNDIAQN